MKRWSLCVLVLTMCLSATGIVVADELKVGFSFAKAPYVVATKPFDEKYYDPNNEGLGFEIELFKAALDGTGHTFIPVYAPFKRVIADLTSRKLDAAETSGADQAGIFYSQPLISCENYAITRKTDNLTITSFEDLKDVTSVAWQGAMTDLGEAFTKVTKGNAKYRENPDQKAQYETFKKGRVQAIVIDKHIFQWWEKQLSAQYGQEELVYHPIFPGVNEYRIGFVSKEIRDAFDAELTRIKEDGTYDQIIQKYVGE